MITDKNLELIASGTDVKTGIYYGTTSIDLSISPDLGSGKEIMAAVNIETYTAGTNSAVVFELITSSAANLQTTPLVVGSTTVLAAALELQDDAGRDSGSPIIVRVAPSHDLTLVGGVTERYFGIRLQHTTANPTALTVNAQIVESIQSPPSASHHASGFSVL